MSDQETIGALTKAVNASDAGRRVGWARAYSAEASKDDLSRDVNILRAERDTMRRAASFLYGFFVIYLQRRGDAQVATQALARWSSQVETVLVDEVTKAGREAAEAVLAGDEKQAELSHAKAEAKAELKRSRNALDRAFKRGQEMARERLAHKYGFPNEAAMLNYLDGYKRP